MVSFTIKLLAPGKVSTVLIGWEAVLAADLT
jgi:hypothetical protein